MNVADRLRSVASGLPGVEERVTWGKPTFHVAGRLFLTLSSDGSCATMKATLGDQASLVAAEPAVFTAAAYLGRYGWITVSLDRCEPDEAAVMVVDAWRQRAPRHLTGAVLPDSGPHRTGSAARRSGQPGATPEPSR